MKFKNNGRAWMSCLGAILCGFAGGPTLGATASGVLGISPVSDYTCIAVGVQPAGDQVVAGVRWYNNDGATVFPELMVVAGYTGVEPDLSNAVVIVENVAGNEDGWSEVAFPQSVTSATRVFYIVFVLPANEQVTARGAGPGIGYAADGGGSEVYLSGEGVSWFPMVTDKHLLVEPVVADGAGKELRPVLVLTAPDGGTDVPPESKSPVAIKPIGLLPAYPNPFNPQTTLGYDLDTTCDVQIAIYDIRGRLVQQFAERNQVPGHHTIVWRGQDEGGRRLASGVYLVKMTAAHYTGVSRVVMLK